MDQNASIALKEAEEKIGRLAEGGRDGDKIRLVGSIVLSIVAAILHQWDAKK